MAKLSKKRYREVLYEAGGNISEVARRLGVARQTVYNNLAKYELEAEVQVAVDSIVGEAEGIVYDQLRAVDADGEPLISARYSAATFILERKGKTRGWSRTYDVSLDGSSLVLAPDVIAMLKRHNISTQMAVQEFEAMIRELESADATAEE